jgi:phosphatidylglycerophosphatase A
MSQGARRVATLFGLGDRLPAPGTLAGSLPTAVVWWGLLAAGPASAWLLSAGLAVAVGLIIAGVWAAGEEASRRGQVDPGPVVIDEVAGQWLTYLGALPFLRLEGALDQALVVGVGFLLFRVFDVVKPWPLSALERLDGGLGIMADDLAGGVLAGAALAALGVWLGW